MSFNIYSEISIERLTDKEANWLIKEAKKLESLGNDWDWSVSKRDGYPSGKVVEFVNSDQAYDEQCQALIGLLQRYMAKFGDKTCYSFIATDNDDGSVWGYSFNTKNSIHRDLDVYTLLRHLEDELEAL